MNYKNASLKDFKIIQSLLKQTKLPYEDCKEHIDNFILIEKDSQVIGIGGLELYNNLALLRSIAVIPKLQGKGLGIKIYNKLKEKAINSGVNRLFLLTQTADIFFEKQGFIKVERDKIPEQIKKTKQFSSLCPSSAIIMSIDI